MVRRWCGLPSKRALMVNARVAKRCLTLAGFLRASGLGTPGPRAKHRASVDAEALGRVTAALNGVGNNVYRIADVLNAGGTSGRARECFAALAEVRSTAATIREIVGLRDRS